MDSLKQYLKKIGVKSPTELNSEELETYKAWRAALSGRRLTDDDVRAFLDKELEESTRKLIDSRLNDHDDLFLKMEVKFIKKIKGFLFTPELEKQFIEHQISTTP